MIDVKFLRENPELVKAKVALKHFDCDIDVILAFDAKRRAAVAEFEDARAAQNAASRAISELPKGSEEFKAKLAEMKDVSRRVKELEAAAGEIEKEWKRMLLAIPNLPDDSVPVGKSAEDNVVVKEWGDISKIKNAVPHWDLPQFEKLLDFRRGVKVTGAGFPFYVGDMARLVRALLSFFLDEARKNGYRELMCPIMVNAASATATGQLPDKEGQMYHDAADDYYMIPTAEVPVTNFYRDEVFEESQLPVCACAYTPCFRREAGSWGKDVRGLNRLHQFDKVELVKWAHPDRSFEELEKLRNDAEGILQKLNLPYRVLSICTGGGAEKVARSIELLLLHGLPGAPRQHTLQIGRRKARVCAHAERFGASDSARAGGFARKQCPRRRVDSRPRGSGALVRLRHARGIGARPPINGVPPLRKLVAPVFYPEGYSPHCAVDGKLYGEINNQQRGIASLRGQLAQRGLSPPSIECLRE